MGYRPSRNLTASIIDYITAQLIVDGWSGVTVMKGNAKVYDTAVPIIAVRLSDSSHTPNEIGSTSTIRETLLFLDIYGSDMGLTEDLKDWAISSIKSGINYYEYVITAGVVHSKTKTGKIQFITIKDSPINFDTPKNELSIQDKWRWLISATIATDKIET